MTVSSSINQVLYSGNGTTVLFPVNYYFLQDSHLQVILVAANGTETVQTLTTNYTVTGAGNEAGGSITMLVAPPTGTQLIIVRNVPATQETDYLANDPFPAESHERALDKLTMLVQQNKLESDRALKVPLASLPTTDTELPIPVGNKLLAWNSNASAIVNFDPADVITITGQQNSYADVFTGNGVTTDFTLTRNPGTVFNIDVSINGVTQVPNVDYILAATTLTFTSAPPAVASQVLARYSEVFTLVDGDAANIRYLPAGGVQTNVQTKLRETVSVKDFGAVGDGVTDDTVAIQTAFSESQNRILFFPAGTYLISQSLYLGARGSIVGEGAKISIIKLTHSGVGLYTRDETGQIDYTRNQQYKNFGIVCNVNTTYGFWVVKALYCYFENVEITVPQATGSTFTAFRVAGSVYLNTFINCVSDTIEESGTNKHGGRGWWVGNGENEEGSVFAATNENTFITCRGQRADIGFDLDVANGAVLMTCGGETCATAGFRLRGANYCQLISPWVEDSVVVIETTQQGNGSGGFITTTPQNNTILPGRNFPLTITAARNTTIVGGRLDSLVIGANADHTVLIKTEILTTLTDNGTYSDLSYYNGGEIIESQRYGATEEYRKELLNSTFYQRMLNGDYIRSNTFFPFTLFSDRGFDFEGASGFVRLPTSSNIPAGDAGKVALYVDTSGGKHRLMAIFPTGVAQQIAIEP